jgi:hypothetical protein
VDTEEGGVRRLADLVTIAAEVEANVLGGLGACIPPYFLAFFFFFFYFLFFFFLFFFPVFLPTLWREAADTT